MDVDMETSPSYFDSQDLSIREQYRRYGKRHSASSISPLLDSSASKFGEARRSNAALFLEDIKQEVDSAYKRRSADSRVISDFDGGLYSSHGVESHSLKACKIEDDMLDSGKTTFSLFASLLHSARQGLISIPVLILHFEKSCRDVSESIRYIYKIFQKSQGKFARKNIRRTKTQGKMGVQQAKLIDWKKGLHLPTTTMNPYLSITSILQAEISNMLNGICDHQVWV